MPRYWCPVATTDPCQRTTHGTGCTADEFGIVTNVVLAQDGQPVTSLLYPQILASDPTSRFLGSLQAIAAAVKATLPSYVIVTPGEDGVSLDFTHPPIYTPPIAIHLWPEATVMLRRTDTGTQLCPFAGTVQALGGGMFTSMADLIAAADRLNADTYYMAHPDDPCLIRVIFRPSTPVPQDIDVYVTGVTSVVRLIERSTSNPIACPAHMPIWWAANNQRYATLQALGQAAQTFFGPGYSFVGVNADQCSLLVTHESTRPAPPPLEVYATAEVIRPVIANGAPECPVQWPVWFPGDNFPPGAGYTNITWLANTWAAQLNSGRPVAGYEVVPFDACQVRVTYRIEDGPPPALNVLHQTWVPATFLEAHSALNGVPAPQLQQYYLFDPIDAYHFPDDFAARLLLLNFGGYGWPDPPQRMVLATFESMVPAHGGQFDPARIGRFRATILSPYSAGLIMFVSLYPQPGGPSGQALQPIAASAGIDNTAGYPGFVAKIAFGGFTTVEWDLRGANPQTCGLMISTPLGDASSTSQFKFVKPDGSYGLEVYT